MRIEVRDTEHCIGCHNCKFACARRHGAGGVEKNCISVRSVGGMARPSVVAVCQACKEPACVRACPTDSLRPRASGGARLDLSTCVGCQQCYDACPIGAIVWNEETGKPILCTHCGYCVQFCPHKVLVSGN
jgi:anaerobic carbon-monoxide dehydrogenase iron sulfur subunit